MQSRAGSHFYDVLSKILKENLGCLSVIRVYCGKYVSPDCPDLLPFATNGGSMERLTENGKYMNLKLF